MVKKILSFVTLLAFPIFIVYFYMTNPVTNASNEVKTEVEYVTYEYVITSIKGSEYYGTAKNGTGISFDANHILSGDIIKMDDKVICYFDSENLSAGLVKVEKKE